jgi:hypothetical protein
MSNATKLISGILLIIVPTIEYDDTFLLHPLRQGAAVIDFQRSMFRVGHAYAGVLVILALVAQHGLRAVCPRLSDGRSASGSCSLH